MPPVILSDLQKIKRKKKRRKKRRLPLREDLKMMVMLTKISEDVFDMLFSCCSPLPSSLAKKKKKNLRKRR